MRMRSSSSGKQHEEKEVSGQVETLSMDQSRVATLTLSIQHAYNVGHRGYRAEVRVTVGKQMLTVFSPSVCDGIGNAANVPKLEPCDTAWSLVGIPAGNTQGLPA